MQLSCPEFDGPSLGAKPHQVKTRDPVAPDNTGGSRTRFRPAHDATTAGAAIAPRRLCVAVYFCANTHSRSSSTNLNLLKKNRFGSGGCDRPFSQANKRVFNEQQKQQARVNASFGKLTMGSALSMERSQVHTSGQLREFPEPFHVGPLNKACRVWCFFLHHSFPQKKKNQTVRSEPRFL